MFLQREQKPSVFIELYAILRFQVDFQVDLNNLKIVKVLEASIIFMSGWTGK